ncbi:MAG: hypothetical protein ABI682_00845 [Acidobacteriota bacterium]
MRHRRREHWKGALVGLVGGALGTLAMQGYWMAMREIAGRDLRKAKAKKPGPLDDMALAGNQLAAGEASTEALGRIAYETATGDEPEKAEKQALSTAVHWSFGCGQGALYGAIRANAEPPDALGGLVLGTALWGFSEVGLPALGFGKGPTAYAAEEHLSTWGAHAVYGLTVSTVTQLLAKLL